jgi:ankyrin repeat protein
MKPEQFKQNPHYLPPKHDEPALHRAARLGDHERIRRLVNEGEDINLPFDIRLDPGGRSALATPLMVAAGSGDGAGLETMRLLLELGANPLLNFGWGSIARFAAGGLGWNYFPGGDAGRLQLSLDIGCDPNETDERGVTLLADAAATGDVDRVKVLLKVGAKPNAAVTVAKTSPFPKIQGSPFDDNAPFSFQIPLHNAVGVNEIEIVTLLIAAGANTHALDRGARTALFTVQSPEVARVLIDAGLDVEDQDCLGWTPLVAAINDGSLEGVKALVSVGANVNATHDRGFTVFMSAVSSSARSLEIMNVLVEAGADPKAVSELGWNAFHAAIDVNGPEANSVESIRSTFELLAKLGVDINHKDAQGVSPLERAKECGTEAEVQALLQLGAMS